MTQQVGEHLGAYAQVDLAGGVRVAQHVAAEIGRVQPGRPGMLDDDMAEVFRSKSGAERLQIASALYSSARRMIISMLHAEHPEWDEKTVHAEAVRRLSHGAI